MTEVYVSRRTPTYGASNRPARISSTSTAPDVKNTTDPASHVGIRALYWPPTPQIGTKTDFGCCPQRRVHPGPVWEG